MTTVATRAIVGSEEATGALREAIGQDKGLFTICDEMGCSLREIVTFLYWHRGTIERRDSECAEAEV